MTCRRLGLTATAGLLAGFAAAYAFGRCGEQGAADPLAGAPTETPQFLEWVEDQLRQPRPPQPLPRSAELAAPATFLQRLERRLSSAKVQSSWSPGAARNEPLASFGPYDTSQRARGNFNSNVLREDIDGSGTLSEQMVIVLGGLKLLCDDIGTIALDIKVPKGDWLDIAWGKDGRTRIPVPDNAQFWKLRVQTAELPKWRGGLPRIEFAVDNPDQGEVELRSLQFFSHEEGFPQAVGVHSVALDKAHRDAIYVHGSSEVRFLNVSLPTGAQWSAALGVSPRDRRAATGLAPITFELLVEESGRSTVVLSDTISESGAWRDVRASLAEWGGKSVHLVLRTTSSQPESVGFWGSPTIYQPVSDAPLVVVYLIDTVSAAHLKLYGYDRETMPRLSQLAEQGVWFRYMHCNAPQTLCSVPNLKLSLTTEKHGVVNASMTAAEELVTLAESFSAGGYATASFITNVNAGPAQNMDQGYDLLLDRIATLQDTDVDRTIPLEEVMQYLKGAGDRPTMVYIHTAEPHAPYTPPPGFAGRFDPDYTGELDGTLDKEHGFVFARSERDLQHIVALYDEELAYADHRLGLFIDALRAAGLMERTTLVITSDHGEEFMEHGRWAHGGDLFNEVLRVPLVVTGPKVTARGRIDVPAQLLDLKPTLLDLFGLPRPYTLDGASLAPLLRGAPATELEAAGLTPTRDIASTNHMFRRRGIIEHVYIEANRWKLYYCSLLEASMPGGGLHHFKLFDLASDPREERNVLDEQPEVLRRLAGKMLTYARAQRPFEKSKSIDPLKFDPAQLDALRAMGYISGGAAEEEEP